MACSARPVGLSITFSASTNPTTKVVPATQYQTTDPRTLQPKTDSLGTVMPSGPPVKLASLVSTIATSSPEPGVATASERPLRRRIARPTRNATAAESAAPANRHNHEGTPKCAGPIATE